MVYDLQLFSICWRNENAIIALENLKKGEKYGQISMKQAHEIINNFNDLVNNEPINLLISGELEVHRKLLYGDLEELQINPEGEKILLERNNNIKRTKLTLDKIIRKENVSDNDLKIEIEVFKWLRERSPSLLPTSHY